MNRAQAASEYLILMAIVLVGLVIAVSVLTDSRSSAARGADVSTRLALVSQPVGIFEYAIGPSGTYLEFVNNAGSPINITAVHIGSAWIASTDLPLVLGAHDRSAVETVSYSVAENATYRDRIVINYTVISTGEKTMQNLSDMEIIGQGIVE